MENPSFSRFAGIAALLSAVLYLLSIVGMQVYLAESLDDVATFTQNMVDSNLMMLLYGWPGLIATVLIIPVVYAFHKVNKSAREVSQMLFLITLVFLLKRSQA